MPSKHDLRLYEQILLLAIHNEKGTLGSGFSDLVVAGAAITELIAIGRIDVEDGRRQLVNVIDPSPTGDPVLDVCLNKITDGKRRASLSKWIPRLAGLKHLRQRAIEQLVADEILLADQKTILGIFKRKIYPELDPVPEAEIVERLRTAIFEEGKAVDVDTCLLVSLANGADLLAPLFGRREMRRHKARVKHLVENELVGKATKNAIAAANAAQVAMLAATTTAATTVAVTSG